MTKGNLKLMLILGLLGIVLLAALGGDHLTVNDPYRTDLAQSLIPPSPQFPFGTDNLGRCVYSRVMEGASASIFSALIVVGAVFVLGSLLGILAGYLGGWWDSAIMKITTIFQAFPSFILAVAIAGMLGPGIRNAILSLAAMYWTTYARLARSLVLKLKDETYIQAARMCGAQKRHIILKYILPNTLPPLINTAVLDIGNVILSMAGLSFLGLGAQPPLAEWGIMISNARSYLQTAPWCMAFPSMALFIVVVLFNLLGDSIRDRLDARGGR
ncbi:nickel transporter permease [Desulfosporosinus youngiae]|uniref:ABC-type dipeptide/oligopeptide/nickel transport system, permease component n=1 Tax=Desulfosporosinus youngiae DSM 17734 TaxID=768710 RepID=H5Y648_9FIRM|nr:nickel transporter permease [Desulfosporosinus youngiae]EHQ91058.1 ABC-type dipeptide/oligopeptide/nickel transport system, permease component [Desulfosporosinus youngiae DSM 17734]